MTKASSVVTCLSRIPAHSHNQKQVFGVGVPDKLSGVHFMPSDGESVLGCVLPLIEYTFTQSTRSKFSVWWFRTGCPAYFVRQAACPFPLHSVPTTTEAPFRST
ncbi:MAG: hypothetical protein GVY07_01310 [Bacteroidetes bacterium]|nr:hypothetical protein [Bacteroidota bacterium]